MKKKTIISYTKLSWIITALLIFTLLFDNLPKNVHADTSSTSINYESIDNENSYLKTELISDKNLSLYLNQTTSIKYKITPQPINTKLDDIVFVVDLSKNMKDNSTQDNSRSRINCVEQTLQKLKGDKNINNANVFIVGYNSEWKNNDSFKNYNAKFDQLSTNKDSCYSKFIDTKSALSSYAGIGKIKNPVTDNFGFYPGSSSYDDYSIKFETNLGDALKTANDYLCKINLEKHRNQSIIMFSRRASLTSTDIGSQYIKDDILCNSIKAKNYKIVTVDISKDMYLPNRDENLKKLQTSLTTVPCQEGYNYITAEPVCSGEEYQYGSFGDQLWNNIFPKLILGTSASDASCVFENVQLNFGLNNSFEVGDKATIIYKGQSINVDVEKENDQISIIIPNNCSNYIKAGNDSLFESDSLEISFEITATAVGNDVPVGKDNDGNVISNLTYTQNIAGEKSNYLVNLDTPIITVGEKDKPQINIKLNDLKVNGVSTKNYYNICPNDDVEFTYKVTAEDLLISDINNKSKKEIVLVLDTSGSMKYGFNQDIDATKTGEKSRIAALKDSAKSFIDKFNNNSDVQIGIVPYSYYAGYVNNIKPFTTISDNNKSDFENYISNITVEGATNQGDGLRKAGQMLLNGDSNAQKYLIVITDGKATSITVKDPEIEANSSIYQWATNVYTFYNGVLKPNNMYKGQYIENTNTSDYMKFYGYYNSQREFILNSNYDYTKNFPVTEINDFNYNQAIKYIDFIDDTINKTGTDYAIKIGKKLKQEMPKLKVETIGCALKTDTVNLAKEVNSSMDGTYYSADNENSTKQIFDDLADSILSDYEIKNVNFNLNIPENFEISPNETSFRETNTGYVKSLENIKYKLNADKTKYVAEPFYITFKLKAKNVGSINFGTTCEVTYNSVKNNQMNSTLPTTLLKIVDERFPKINIELSPKEVTYLDKNIDINYKINPQEFSYKDIYGELLPKDVFLLIDSSSANKVNIGNNIFNKIESDKILQLAKTRYSIITYGNNTTDGIRYVNESMGQRDIQNEGVYSKYIEDVLNSASNSNSQGSTCNILPALRKVEDIDKNGRGDKDLTKSIDNDRKNGEKYIIIVGEKNITDINELSGEAKILSDKGYKIVTLNLGDIIIKDKWKTQGGYKDSEEGEIEPNNNLKEMHYKLSNEIIRSNETLQDRIDNNYFIKINYDQFNSYKKDITQMNQFFNQQDNFSLNLLNNQVSPKITFGLRGSFDEELSIINPQFEFNLQDKCSIIGTPKYDDAQDVSNFQHKQNDENAVTFNVPTISYKFDYNAAKYQLTSMSARPIVTLTIKPKDTIQSTFKFSDGQAFFNYKDIVYGLDKKLPLDTPSIMFNTNLPDLF
ncbi:VWA domain-containing protein [Clostridium chromiireducens]|uniref:VWA domain-containing protein n=1 Tax=Clostridium chromiireducens TaxID=225345 RepID=A0A964RIY7_9CLOT|nr:VWA domain-containing protein [Clostridium chromiireducens]MVX62579.1 VWA domain-containing protein [Clostridium chromiireducens]